MKSITTLALLIASICCASAGKTSRIFGGTQVEDGKYPFAVSLRNVYDDYGHHCGGAIINSRWVVTAAHCLVDIRDDQFTIGAGAANFEEGSPDNFTVILIIRHENYVINRQHDDVGLLKVDRDFDFANPFIKPAVLYPHEIPEGYRVTAMGWGAGNKNKHILEEVTGVTISLKKCKNHSLVTNELCASFPKGSGTCFGDSGSPIVAEGTNYLVGLVSWGTDCGGGKDPDFYTRISAYYDWIQDTMAKNS